MFDSPGRLALGLVTGLVFGFLLQKGRVAKFRTILGQLLLKDWTVLRVMTTAILVGAVGVYLLVATGAASLHLKPFLVGGVLLGAVTFGVGMAVFGYCPGTSVAACGEGAKDAMAGVAGMFAGALAYVLAYPRLEPAIRGLGDLGEVTLPEVLGVSPWAVIAALAALLACLLWGIGRVEPRLAGMGSPVGEGDRRPEPATEAARGSPAGPAGGSMGGPGGLQVIENPGRAEATP